MAADNGILAPGSLVNGCYAIKSILGRGGMGEVYLAVEKNLQREIAVKILLPAIVRRNEDNARRFQEEARLQANLQHKSIITVYATGYDEHLGVYFMAMEYVHGEALSTRLKCGDVYTEEEALDICLKVARVMETVTYKGRAVVHRDIKPANIMLTQTGEVKLADWGIARIGEPIEGEAEAPRRQALGTPAYMSPEQVLDPDSVDARADIYSLGVTLYELLSGKRPYNGRTTQEIIKQIMHGRFPDIEAALPEIHEATVNVLRSMMDRRRELRSGSWEHLAELLQEAKVKVMASSRQPPRMEKIKESAPRLKTVVAIVAAVMIALSGTTLFFTGGGSFIVMRNGVKSMRMTNEQKEFFEKNFMEIPWEVVLLNSGDLDLWIELWRERQRKQNAQGD